MKGSGHEPSRGTMRRNGFQIRSSFFLFSFLTGRPPFLCIQRIDTGAATGAPAVAKTFPLFAF
ncbi:MAG: hypothetical protein CVU61_11825 [Deltaproteobacteria bacterium HGW-Deltaproteobacteria-19]|nr:MAG: hypothetical protein CVU61_11825 [Deltaproteobacteria bacterium HGW-Deltaproteobacteria-19]